MSSVPVATLPPIGRAFLKMRPVKGKKGKAWHRNDGDRLSRSHDLVLPEFRLATGLHSPRSPDITASSSFKLLPLGIQQTSQKQALYSGIEETQCRTSLDKQISVSHNQRISWKSRTREELLKSWQNPKSLRDPTAASPRKAPSPQAEYTDSTNLISTVLCFNSHPSYNWGPEDGP